MVVGKQCDPMPRFEGYFTYERQLVPGTTDTALKL